MKTIYQKNLLFTTLSFLIACTVPSAVLLGMVVPSSAYADYRFDTFEAKPPIHILKSASAKPRGLSPATIKRIYNIPEHGGQGTIAIVGAYESTSLESDLAQFNKTFNIDACTVKNGCLEIHSMQGASTKKVSVMNTGAAASDSSSKKAGWNMEMALDVEWAHAIAPQAKILVVEADTPSGANLLKAVDYARNKKDVVAVSMSWGGAEFQSETTLDDHFVPHTPTQAFFAASGDTGNGASWPAVSPHVVAVGGTHLTFVTSKKATSTVKESAWKGSGGGISIYEPIPDYQKQYSLAKNKNMRSVPDVSYNADPASGYSVYVKGIWYVVGGTSAGAPQWAAIHSIGLSASAANLYADKQKSTNADYFRDIVSGTNGSCGYMCTARARYDYVTGLGSPLTVHF